MPIRVYVFAEDEKNRRKTSDERICECAGLFLATEQKEGRGDALPEVGFPAIRRELWKKPRFEPDFGLYFSVSHSGGFWVCAVSEAETGIDIQRITADYNPGIAQRFFHADEHKHLETNGFEDFFKIWTAKESYVKFTGEGIGGFPDFSAIKEGRVRDEINGVRIRFLDMHPEYCLCLCAERTDEVKVENPFDPF